MLHHLCRCATGTSSAFEEVAGGGDGVTDSEPRKTLKDTIDEKVQEKLARQRAGLRLTGCETCHEIALEREEQEHARGMYFLEATQARCLRPPWMPSVIKKQEAALE
jgi:hypothetical protein